MKDNISKLLADPHGAICIFRGRDFMTRLRKAVWIVAVVLVLTGSLVLTISLFTGASRSAAAPSQSDDIYQLLQSRASAGLSEQSSSQPSQMASRTLENGKQVITISARGGYSPPQTVAQAGLPTILRMVTKGTFDCSRALIIPSMQLEKILPASGTVDIDLPPQMQGTRLFGICAMGMYSFAVSFK